MIIYDKLINILSERKIKKGDFADAIGIQTATMNALSKNRNVNISTIDKICSYLNCQPGDILEYVDDSYYKQQEKQSIETQIAELQAKLKNI